MGKTELRYAVTGKCRGNVFLEGNLTKGPILKSLTKLAIPIMASSFLGTLYNITDMAWIGLLGAKAVAGVGVGGMFTWLSQGLASMARMGGQVQVAQYIGCLLYTSPSPRDN